MSLEVVESAPEGWERTTLGVVCKRGGGFVQTGPFGSQLHASDYVPDGVPSIMPTNLGGWRVDPSGIARVPEADAHRLSRHRVRPGDIVFSRRGDVERHGLVTLYQTGWLCGTGCLLVRPGTGGVNPTFLSLWLRHPEVRGWLVGRAVGSTMPNLNTTIMSEVPIALPPPAVQQGIAETLGALDEQIELNRRTRSTAEEMAAALFKSWFVDFDPVVARADGRKPFGMDMATAALFPSSFETGHDGAFPCGWRWVSLRDITDKIGSGATPTGGSQVYVDAGVSLIRSQNVYDSRFVWDGLARIGPEHARDLNSVTVRPTDVLINITGASFLRTCVVDADVLPARVNQHVAIVRPALGVPAHFIHLHLVRPRMKETLAGHDAGGSRQAITKAHLEGVPILLPSHGLLDAFAKSTEPWFKLAEANTRESRILAALRDALLPKLLSGEVRLKQAEKAVEPVL
jgi:type I restriction enzyme S subunit